MSLERLISVKADTQSAVTEFNKLQRKLKAIDDAVSKMGASIKGMANDLSRSGNESSKAVKDLKARTDALIESKNKEAKATEASAAATKKQAAANKEAAQSTEKKTSAEKKNKEQLSQTEKLLVKQARAIDSQNKANAKYQQTLNSLSGMLNQNKISQSEYNDAVAKSEAIYSQSGKILKTYSGYLDSVERTLLKTKSAKSDDEKEVLKLDQAYLGLGRSLASGEIGISEYADGIERASQRFEDFNKRTTDSRLSLDNMEGVLTSVQRASMQFTDVLSREDKALLELDTKIKRANLSLMQGKFTQEQNEAAIRSANVAYEEKIEKLALSSELESKSHSITQDSRKTLENFAGTLKNVDRIRAQSMKGSSHLTNAMLEEDTMVRRLAKSYYLGNMSQKDFADAKADTIQYYTQVKENAAALDAQLAKGQGMFKAMKGSAAQMGMQLQDVAVQAQMGTDAFIILAQQGPQIASLFGVGGAALGAVIAIGAAIGGPLLSSVLNLDDAMKTMMKGADELDEVFERTSGGAVSLTDKIIELYQASEAAGNLELTIAMSTLDESIRNINKSIGQVLDGSDAFLGFIGGFDTKATVQALKNLDEAGINVKQIFEELSGVRTPNLSIDFDASVADKDVLKDNISNLADEYAILNESAIDFVRVLSDIQSGADSIEGFEAQQVALNAWINSLQDSGQITKDNYEALNGIFRELQKIIALGQQRFVTKEAFESEDALKNFAKINSSLSDIVKYGLELDTSSDKYNDTLRDIASNESSIQGIMIERLRTLTDQEEMTQARNKALEAIRQAERQSIADLLNSLDTQAEKERAINELKARGLTITQDTETAARRLNDAYVLTQTLQEYGSDNRMEILANRLRVVKEAISLNGNTPTLDTALQNIKEEMIELAQSKFFLDDINNIIKGKFNANEGPLQYIRELRAAGQITGDQFDVLNRDISGMYETREQTQKKSIDSLNAEVAAWSKGKDAAEAYKLEQQAIQALGFGENTNISDDQQAKIDAYVAKLKQLAELQKDIGKENPFKNLADTLERASDVFGDLTKNLSNVSSVFADMIDQQEDYEKKIKDADGDNDKLAKAHRENAQSQMQSYGDLAGAAKGFFDEESKGYQTLEQVQKAFRAAEMAMSIAATTQALIEGQAKATAAVANQGLGDPYTAFGRIAAMAALMAGIGFAVSGGSASDPTADRQASQGTGTVLGDSSAKSESIANALEYSNDALDDLVSSNQGILDAMQVLSRAISGASNLIARDVNYSGIAGNLSEGGLGNTASFIGGNLLGFGALTGVSAAGLYGGSLLGGAMAGSTSLLTGGLTAATGGVAAGLFAADQLLLDGMFTDMFTGIFSSVASAVFGGGQKVTDEGVKILGGTLEEIINGTAVKAFQTVKTDGGLFSSDSIDDVFADVSESVERQFDLTFQSIFDAVSVASSSLGFDSAEISDRMSKFVVDSIKISLEGLTGSEIEEELNAVFSSTFDNLAGAALPIIKEFQESGEGLGETLSRVATNFQVTNEVISQLNLDALKGTAEENLRLSESFIEMMGGASEAVSGMSSFVESFATEERQLEILHGNLVKALGEQDRAILESKDGVYAYVDAIKDSGEAELARVANILNLTSSLDDYFSLLESVNKAQAEQRDYTDLMIRLAEVQGKTDLATRLSREEELSNATSETARTYLKVIYSVEDAQKTLEDSANAINKQMKTIQSNTDSALNLLGRSINAQKEVINKDFSDRIEQANNVLTGLGDTISNLKLVIDSIDGVLEQARLTTRDIELSQIRAARARVSEIRSSGVEVTNLEEFSKLLGVASGDGDAKRYYKTFEEYVKEQVLFNNDLSQIKENAEEQLSESEKLQRTNEDILEQLEESRDQQLEALDAQMDAAESQLNALRGIDDSIMDVASALDRFYQLLSKEQEGTSSYSAADIRELVASIHEKNTVNGVLDWDAAEREIGIQAIKLGISYAELANAIGVTEQKVIDRLNELNVTSSNVSDTAVTETQNPQFSKQNILDYVRAVYAEMGMTDAADYKIGMRAIEVGVSSQQLADAVGGNKESILNRVMELGLPAFETGGDHYGGYMVAGENGPELIASGAARVFNASQTAGIFNASNSTGSEYMLGRIFDMLRELNIKMIESNKNTKPIKSWFREGSIPVSQVQE